MYIIYVYYIQAFSRIPSGSVVQSMVTTLREGFVSLSLPVLPVLVCLSQITGVYE